ncbi:hypothetical protein MP638_004956 [Amoeboaphelidium occidentale]|nr:hypothetical protein MP638_004956 [Amoeboaphelidium occidentale]
MGGDSLWAQTSGPRYNYPKWVWSPTGGWWADPKYWRRNLAGVVSAFLIPGTLFSFWVSSQYEEYHRPPQRFYLSMLYAKQFQEGGKYYEEAMKVALIWV